MIFLKIAKFDGNYINIPGRYFYCYKLLFVKGVNTEGNAYSPKDVCELLLEDLETLETSGKKITVVVISNISSELWKTETNFFDFSVVFISQEDIGISFADSTTDQILTAILRYLCKNFTYNLNEDPLI